MNVRLIAPAQADVLDAADWYDGQAPGLGATVTAAVRQVAANLATFPRLFGRVRRAPAEREVRGGALPGFPYTVVYEVTPTELLILSVAHSPPSVPNPGGPASPDRSAVVC